MKIAIASDHGGFNLKEQLKKYVESFGHEVIDLGCYSADRADYPDHGIACGEAVVEMLRPIREGTERLTEV